MSSGFSGSTLSISSILLRSRHLLEMLTDYFLLYNNNNNNKMVLLLYNINIEQGNKVVQSSTK